MNCPTWEEDLALHAGGDPVSPGFLAHLPTCPGCQAELADLQSARRQWTDWTPTAPPRRARWPWAIPAAALLPVAFWPQAPLETLALSMPPAPAAPAIERSRPTPVAPPHRREPATTIKLFTDDPDVVILLLGDAE